MIEIKTIKQNVVFIFIISLFTLIVISCAIIFIKYQNVLNDTSKAEEDKMFEINLPVIEWGKYENLSKKLPNGNIEKSK